MNRTRSFVASAAAVVVTAAGLTLATPVLPAFASTSFALSPSVPIVGESFAATGRVSTKFKRPVVLRVYSGGAWRTAKSGWTTSSGTYRLPTAGVSTPTAFAVLARAYKHHGRTYGQTSSAKRVARPVSQTASISVLPKIVQRGSAVASSESAANSVLARFSPARPGRKVTFQRTVGGRVLNTTTTEKSDGTALFRGSLAGGSIHAVAATRYSAPAIATGEAADDWAPVFTEEFSGSTLDTSKWDYRLNGLYIPGRTKSKSDAGAVTVGGGSVALKVAKAPGSTTRLLNGHISTENSFHFTYGTAAARVKFQQGRGSHGSFWLQSPTYGKYAGSPASSGAEIDAAEFFGRGYPNGGLANFLYYKTSSGKTSKTGAVQPGAARLKPSSDSWWNSYHVFAVNWTPTGYTFYVDGQKMYSTNRALSKQQEFLVLSLLSSDYELKYLDRSHLSTQSLMRVDWARVWQR
ncbi:MAG: glycoside hydrolase family 16 protein [Nocardioidaceae bacterium]